MNLDGQPTNAELSYAPPHSYCYIAKGHFATLEVFYSPCVGGRWVCLGGNLRMASAIVELTPEHASNLAERARTGLDEVILGAMPLPPPGRLQ